MRRTAERVGRLDHTFCFIASTIIHRSSITDRLRPRAWRRGRDDGEPATLLERNINTAKRCRCRLRRSGAETIWGSRLLLSTRRAAVEMASEGNQHCANCISTLSFPIRHGTGSLGQSPGHIGHLPRPGHRVIIWTRCETRVFPVFEKCPK